LLTLSQLLPPQSGRQESNALFGLVVCGGHVVTTASAPAAQQSLQSWDILLLLNFLKSNDAFLEGEAFTPVCLPHYNPNANLHAYINCMHRGGRTTVMLLAGGSEPDFHQFSAARERMQMNLEDCGGLEALAEAAAAHSGLESTVLPANLPDSMGGGPAGTMPLLHLAYKHNAKQLFVSSPFVAPYPTGLEDQQVKTFAPLFLLICFYLWSGPIELECASKHTLLIPLNSPT
jgi:hypothetical protein